MTPQLVFFANLLATWYLVGLIWVIQLVHYPLMRYAAGNDFVAFELAHTQRMGYVVMAPMLIELGTAALLVAMRPAAMPWWAAAVGLGLVLLAWAVTFAISVPLHNILGQGWDAVAHERLVVTNWLRTVAWSARGVLVAWVAWRMMA